MDFLLNSISFNLMLDDVSHTDHMGMINLHSPLPRFLLVSKAMTFSFGNYLSFHLYRSTCFVAGFPMFFTNP